MLALSLGLVFTAAPVAADEDEWSTYDYPDEGADGDYFYDSAITVGPGPVARDIDGYFWIYANPDTTTDDLLKSLDTEGRSWEVTEYQTETAGSDIVAIAVSSIDADVVYVADDADDVFKTEDGGDTWTDLGFVPGNAAEVITSLAVGYADDEPHVYVGTMWGTEVDANYGEVYYYYDVAFARVWTDLDVSAPDSGGAIDNSDVWGLAASPDFDNDTLVAAVISDNIQGESFATVNLGAGVGITNWDDVELPLIAANIVIDESSDPVFVDDFDADDAYEFFVGISDATVGRVYRIYGATDVEVSELDDVNVDIISLDLAGNIGDTYLLAGTQDTADVWYSDDDGDSWLLASAEGIQPTGTTNTYVIADADIADTSIGWAVTDGAEGAVSMTADGGAVWLGISLINTDIDSVEGLALSPDFASPGLMFVLTDDVATGTDSVFRYDGSNWERVYESTQYAQVITLIAVSPDINTDDMVFLGDTASNTILFSEDNGTVWEAVRTNPGDLDTWVIVDAETIIAGGLVGTASTIWVTDVQGRRAWDDYVVEAVGTDTITSLAVNGDTVIAGNNDSDVFISEDFGETWDAVGARIDAAVANTFVTFDSGDPTVIYAAADDTIARFLDTGELDEDWENFTEDALSTVVLASGIFSSDGVLYVADPTAVVLQTGGAGVGRGAIQRSVNPLEDLDDVDASEFDFVDGGLTAGDIFNSLDLTAGNILWAVDTAAATIFTYEDVMAAPITGVVADPDVDTAILSWDGFDNAADYDVVVYGDEDMTLAYEWYDNFTGDDNPILMVNDNVTTGVHITDPLDAGTTYWVQVRATLPVNSKWSDAMTFTTDPATMAIDADFFGPAIGATNVPITPAFGWDRIAEADEYVIEVSDTANFSNIIETATVTDPVYQLQATLANSTNYFWRVKAISGTSESAWATGTFTTAAAPVVAPTPPAPPAPVAPITIPPVQQITPNWIYAIIGIGASLAVLVIVLILKTRPGR